ncbi:MAG: hypothetical protein M2R45_04361 [Verrucomicrobia subdivision 3 bacterium]|nr:hypothetical protein [Limisphaerales bacterium]MCS1416065.1 hypothetical protein [Limisphaerales bacterium]
MTSTKFGNEFLSGDARIKPYGMLDRDPTFSSVDQWNETLEQKGRLTGAHPSRLHCILRRQKTGSGESNTVRDHQDMNTS